MKPPLLPYTLIIFPASWSDNLLNYNYSNFYSFSNNNHTSINDTLENRKSLFTLVHSKMWVQLSSHQKTCFKGIFLNFAIKNETVFKSISSPKTHFKTIKFCDNVFKEKVAFRKFPWDPFFSPRNDWLKTQRKTFSQQRKKICSQSPRDFVNKDLFLQTVFVKIIFLESDVGQDLLFNFCNLFIFSFFFL